MRPLLERDGSSSLAEAGTSLTKEDRNRSVLGGSWVVISGVISRVTILITPNRGLITKLITTHEPRSSGYR